LHVIIIGLTGGIGMGKSTIARAFRRARFPVFDADAAVHRLQAPGGRALPAIAAAFPGSVSNDVLNRAALRAAVLPDPAALKRLERILHPMVRAMERAFLARARRARVPAAVLDIPLLLETRGKNCVDVVMVVSTPRAVQIRRVLARGKMSRTQIEQVIARQMPDVEKRRRADVVIRNGLSRHYSLMQVKRFIQGLYA
jgi:dephospho-CoA kinase